jgi:hypothetical protein
MLVSGFGEQRLVGGIATAQPITSNALQVEMDFTTYQTVQPKTVNCEAMAKQVHVAFRIGASQINQCPTEVSSQVEVPSLRKGSALRGSFPALGRRSAK